MTTAELKCGVSLQAITTASIFLSVVLLAGCGGHTYDAATSAKAGLPGVVLNYESAKQDVLSKSEAVQAGDSLDKLETAPNETSVASRTTIGNRKIIYNTNIGLVVEDYDSFENQLPLVVAQRGGFIANSNTDRRYNNNQRGTWIVRIPVVEYTEFLSGISALGFAESRTENAQDVTEEYVDIEARIKNKKQLEVRVLEMLDQRKGPLKDVLEIERELARIREEVERMEGRIRFLKDRTSLATVTITCREEKEYQPAAAPTLASRMSNSWGNSLASLQRVGESFLVGLVGAVPWIGLATLVLGLLVLLTRKYWPNVLSFGAQSN